MTWRNVGTFLAGSIAVIDGLTAHDSSDTGTKVPGGAT